MTERGATLVVQSWFGCEKSEAVQKTLQPGVSDLVATVITGDFWHPAAVTSHPWHFWSNIKGNVSHNSHRFCSVLDDLNRNKKVDPLVNSIS